MMSRPILQILCLTFVLARSAEAPAQTPDPQAPASHSTTTQDTTPQLTVDQARQRAMAAFEELRGGVEADRGEALLDEIRSYEQVIMALEPDNAWLGYIRGRLAIAVGRSSAGSRLLLAFVDLREGRNEWTAFRELGDIFVAAYPSMADGFYRTADELNAGQPSVLLGRARAASELGDLTRASEFAAAAIRADTTRSVDYPGELARILLRNGQVAEALNQAEEARRRAEQELKGNPGGRREAVKLDRTYALLLDVLGSLMRETPMVSDYYLHAARTVNSRSQVRRLITLHDALAVLELGIARGAPKMNLLMETGAIEEMLGRVTRAVQAYQQVLEIDPNHAGAKQKLEALLPQAKTPSPP